MCNSKALKVFMLATIYTGMDTKLGDFPKGTSFTREQFKTNVETCKLIHSVEV